MLCLLNWLIPGAGYLAVRDVSRGITLFLVINFCFAMGVLLGGYILVPATWSPRAAGFNLVGTLTYICQVFDGGGWLLVRILQNVSAGDADAFFNIKGQAVKTYSDLGAFHLVVAGGLNYFATVRLYDLLAGNPELSAESEAADEPEKEQGGQAT